MGLKNDHQLRKWLMREIHGVEIARKPPGKSLTLTGKPARNVKYRAWIRSLPCAVCGQEPAGEAAHTGSDGGLRQKSSDYSCIPLCTNCHTMSPHAFHRIGRQAFERRHAIGIEELARRLTSLWFRAGNSSRYNP